LPKLFTKPIANFAADAAPVFHVRFYPFVSINNTIRLREGEIYIRLSDLLEGSPDGILHSILHILLAKLYRQPVERAHSGRYRRYIASHDVTAKARLVRQMRGRKHIRSARDTLPLEEIFDDLNRRFFHGLLGRRNLPGARTVPAAAWATTTRRTTPSSSAAFSTIRGCRDMRSNTSCITRCCI